MIDSKYLKEESYNLKSFYEKFSDECLVDNSYFEETERVAIHDTIGHKIMNLMWNINFEEETEENVNLISKLNEEISTILNDLIERIKIVLV